MPAHAHAGDVVHVSGFGFDPHVHEPLFVACPNVGLSAEGDDFRPLPDPTTDRQGNFVDYRLRTHLVTHAHGPMSCTVYAQVGPNPFGADIKGTFEYLPPTFPVDACDRRICGVLIQAQPLHVHQGLSERIQIRAGWPGSVADISIGYPGLQTPSQKVHLDAHGNGSAKFVVRATIPPAVRSVLARVRVRLSLGAISGNANGKFTVLR